MCTCQTELCRQWKPCFWLVLADSDRSKAAAEVLSAKSLTTPEGMAWQALQCHTETSKQSRPASGQDCSLVMLLKLQGTERQSAFQLTRDSSKYFGWMSFFAFTATCLLVVCSKDNKALSSSVRANISSGKCGLQTATCQESASGVSLCSLQQCVQAC